MGIEQLVRQVMSALAEQHNVLLYGPPGTGKTFLMNEIRTAFINPEPPIFLNETAESDFFEEFPLFERTCRASWWITFHQSYSYEDFIIGLRTVPGAGFQLEPKQGPLLEAAEHARIEDGASILLIDEINRGNTSRILGEFITVMESSKRLGSNGNRQQDTVDIILPHILPTGLSFTLKRPNEEIPRTVIASNPFTMPWHVYVLASMNSVDRTVAPIDTALRRRFSIIELGPDYEFLSENFQLDGTPDQYGKLPSQPDDLEYWRRLAVRLLYQINYRIRSLVGDDFQLGHTYLIPLFLEQTIEGFKHRLKSILETNIVPQLEEMLRADPAVLGAALLAVDPGVDSKYPYRFENIPDELLELAARRPLTTSNMDYNEIEQVVRRLGSVSEP